MGRPVWPSLRAIKPYHQYIHPRQRPSRSSTNKKHTSPATHPSHQYSHITNTSIHNKTINNTKLPTSLAYGQLSHARGQAGRLLTNNAHTQPTVHLNNTTISPIYPSTTKQ